jgi:hypothetical protein
VPTTREPPTPDAVSWRSGRLRDAGFPAALAERLASDPGYDLHALMNLTDRGCPPDLAARIVAPLDLPTDLDLPS